MHKITKGLKKKKNKNKKHKKEDDLFDEVELEKYRRQHQQDSEGGQQVEQDEQGAGSSDNEEWQRFKALTAGVDSVLKKTQGDLNRIKSSSYFQRKPPGPSVSDESPGKPVDSVPTPAPRPAAVSDKKKSNRWVGFEEGSSGIDTPESHESEEEPTQTDEKAALVSVDELLGAEPAAAATIEEEEEEEEPEDDIFDTSYVDVVKLAYIPDSPTQEDEGFDPFDTSIAEKLIKEEEEKAKNKKKLVSLGCAVEVLTGRLETTPTVAGKKRRAVPRRPQDVSLLLDENAPQEAEDGQEVAHSLLDDVTEPSLLHESPAPCRSLLEEDSEASVPVVPLGDSVVASTAAATKETEENKENSAEEGVDFKNLVAEFDLISSGETDVSPSTVIDVRALVEEDDDLENEFAALAAESVSKKPSDLQEEQEVEEKDPFDTTVAAVVLGDQPPERDPFDIEADFNTDTLSFPSQKTGPPFPISPDVDIVLASEPQPKRQWAAFEEQDGDRPSRPPPPHPKPPQSVASFTDQEFTDNAILALAEDLDITQLDPFDTSFAENILPGKAELKLIESEILGCSDIEINEARILSQSDSDFDFNPRENEERVVSTVSIQITDPAGKDQEEDEETGLRSLTLGHRDLLGGSTTDLSKLGHDPIQPVEQEQEPETEIDPFDTSVVEVLAAPGKAELKFLEKELLGETECTLKRSLSDQDFNPRAEEPEKPKTEEPEVDVPDLLNVRVGVPKVVAFDVPTPSARPDLLVVGSEEGTRISKPLTPYYVNVQPADIFATHNGEVEDTDPFDTSFVEKLAPGKAELKIIENELVGEPICLKHSLSDQEFNPRSEDEAASTVKTEVVVNKGRRFSDFAGDRRRAPPCTLAIKGVAVTPVPLEVIHAVPTPASKPDLLVVEENAPVTAKPLTPAVESTLEYADPFDTSIANNLLPGRAELKVLESELVSSIKRSYTDPDFNPRADDPVTGLQSEPENVAEKPDLLNLPSEVVPDTKTLTPRLEKSVNSLGNYIVDDIDPFDTSIASNLVPGKAELRVLESELIGQ